MKEMSMSSVKAKTTKSPNMVIKYLLHQPKIATLQQQLPGTKRISQTSKTLEDVIDNADNNREKPIKQAVCDRGYRGVKQINGTKIILPNRPLKRDNRYQRDKKRRLCKRRAAIEPIIGHLKQDYKYPRNYLKGQTGDEFNVFMAACAWNLNKWIIFYYFLLFFIFIAKNQ